MELAGAAGGGGVVAPFVALVNAIRQRLRIFKYDNF
jgi:hypothetical protein